MKVFVSDNSLSSHRLQEEKHGNLTIVRFKPAGKYYYEFLGYHAALSYHFSEIIIQYAREVIIPSFIEVQDYQGIGYYLLQRKKIGEEIIKNVPIILTLHSPSYFYHDHCRDPLYKLPTFWIGEMEKWTMRAADIFISPSKYMLDNTSNEIGDKLHLYNVLPNPYALDNTPKTSNEIEIGDIVFFGKLTYQKGSLDLIKTMSKLWDEGFAYPLKIIGDDHFYDLYQMSMKEYIIKKYRKYYDKGKIQFEGKLEPHKLNTRLAKAQVVIVPSIVDNFPYVVVEAMALGKVVLVSNGGGQVEIIEDGKSGFIYNLNELSSFSQQLKRILSLSAEEYSLVSKRAVNRICSLCSYDVVFENKMNIINNYVHFSSNEYPFTRVIQRKIPVKELASSHNKLSIVIPYYNTGKYLEETIKNLLLVNYANKEIIIVNDGSDEIESLHVLEYVNEKYPVKIVTQDNLGLPGARNTGAMYASGEYLAFLDADDMVDSNYYAKAINIMNKYENVSFVGCWTQYFDGAKGVWPTFTPEPPYILLHNSVNSSSLVYKRADFITSGMNDMDMMPAYEDYQSVVHLVQNGFRGIIIPELLFNYRIHPDSLSRTFNPFIHLDAYKLLTKKHNDFFKEYSTDIINLLQANGPSFLFDNPTYTPYYSSLNSNQKDSQNPNEGGRFSAMDEDKVEVIKLWYHQEYEVLPLWFKRLGHLIKIVTGKRKLFN